MNLIKDPFQSRVEDILNYLDEYPPNSDEYSKAVQNLSVLCEARAKRAPTIIDLDMVVGLFGNLVGIVLILQHEKFNVISTRAMSWIRPKL